MPTFYDLGMGHQASWTVYPAILIPFIVFLIVLFIANKL